MRLINFDFEVCLFEECALIKMARTKLRRISKSAGAFWLSRYRRMLSCEHHKLTNAKLKTSDRTSESRQEWQQWVRYQEESIRQQVSTSMTGTSRL